MKLQIFLASLVLALTACSNQTDQSDANTAAADAIYVNAKIYTVDRHNSWADAVAVKDGKIQAVGTDSEVRAFANDETIVNDLQGRMLMPGIHDTHMHPSDAGVQKTLECNFLSYDLNEVLEILKTCVADIPEGGWLRGGQWNDALLASGKTPKIILDEIAPNHPVFLIGLVCAQRLGQFESP